MDKLICSLRDDHTELCCLELVDGILEQAQVILFEKHISAQVMPYAVEYTKNTLLKMMEWEQFHEENNQLNWIREEVPQKVKLDSYSKGVL